jgi:uncharacterized RDD family membrane protein YckC
MNRRRSKSRRAAQSTHHRRPPAASPSAVEPAPPGLARRLAALVYDTLLLAAILFAATLVLLPLRGGEAFGAGDPLFSAYLLGVGFVFFGWFWTHGGQTLGMRAWNIRLQNAAGGPVSWRQAAVRSAVAVVSAGAFGLGYAWILVDSRKRSWHDLASGTRVVRIDQA